MKKKVIFVTLVLIIMMLGMFGCHRDRILYETPIPVDETFSTQKPDQQELMRYQNAAHYSRKHEGVALVVIKGQNIVFEQYHNDSTAETPHHIFSGTKSFAGVMAMAAVEDGLLDLDEPVAKTIPSFQDDERKKKITIRHLLQFTSGIKQSFLFLSWDTMFAKRWVANKYEYALKLAAKFEPGARYEYGPSHLMIFGEVMRRKLHRDPLVYLHRRIFYPIGFHYSGWIRDNYGNPMLAYGTWTTAREWCKFGLLVKDDGKFMGKQILAPGLIKQCLQGSQAMPAYGLTFWLNQEVPKDLRPDLIPPLRPNPPGGIICNEAPADLVAAAGYNGNRLYIIPSQDLVIARMGKSNDFVDSKFLKLILPDSSDTAR